MTKPFETMCIRIHAFDEVYFCYSVGKNGSFYERKAIETAHFVVRIEFFRTSNQTSAYWN